MLVPVNVHSKIFVLWKSRFANNIQCDFFCISFFIHRMHIMITITKKVHSLQQSDLTKKKTTWTSLSRSVYIGSGFCALLSKVKFDRFQRQSNFIERICWYCRLNRLRARSKKDPLVFERWEKVKFLIIRRQIKLAYYDTENCNFQNVD